MLLNPYRFTPPGPVTLLGLDFEGSNGSTTFTETTGKAATVHGAAQISTAQFYAGSSSGLFNGSSAALSFASAPAFNLASLNWRFSFAVRMTSLGADGEVFAHRNSGDANNFLLCRVQTNGRVRFYSLASGVLVTDVTTTASVSVGAWSFVQITRSAGSVSIDLDGNTGLTVAANGSGAYVAPAFPFQVGRGDNSSSYLAAYLDAFLLERLP